VCLYRVTLEQYVDEVEAKTPAEARHQAQLNAIHNNARPVPTESELATILAAGKETGWDFEEPALREYSEFALDHAATYQVVEPGTLDSETLKLVE
jgi:nucleoside-diphosphate-sugar epimerase